jgi:YaiO family outer membrane protein
MGRQQRRLLAARLIATAAASVFAGGALAQDAQDPPDAAGPWAVSAVYTHSDLGSGRDNWDQLDLDLYHRANRQWVFTGGADVRRRGDFTDTVYSVGAEYYATPAWRFHAGVMATPGADFTYDHGYAVGAEWRATPWLSLLLDTRGFDFEAGNLREWRPGATVWFNDDATAITARYTDGDAFDGTNYDGWSLRLDQDFGAGHRLSLGYAHGVDPERDPGVPGVLLSEADFYSAYYRFPLRGEGSGLDLILGAEYEERPAAWTRRGLSVGLAARF